MVNYRQPNRFCADLLSLIQQIFATKKQLARQCGEVMARYLIQKAPRLGLIVWVLNVNEIRTLSGVGCLVSNAAVPYRGLFGLWVRLCVILLIFPRFRQKIF
jgi:hypothetical protein